MGRFFFAVAAGKAIDPRHRRQLYTLGPRCQGGAVKQSDRRDTNERFAVAGGGVGAMGVGNGQLNV